MCYGDGHLDKYGQLNIQHCAAQLDYLTWKRKLLMAHGIKCCDIKFRNSNGFPAYYFSTKVYNFSKLFRKILYTPKKKIGIRKQLDKFTPLHLSIWYMDDGSLTQLKNKDGYVRGNTLRIHTNVSKEENQIIIDYFKEKWNIKFGLQKVNDYYCLSCHTKEARKFIKIVEPFVRRIPSMQHKLKVKVLTHKSIFNGRAKWLEKEAV